MVSFERDPAIFVEQKHEGVSFHILICFYTHVLHVRTITDHYRAEFYCRRCTDAVYQPPTHLPQVCVQLVLYNPLEHTAGRQQILDLVCYISYNVISISKRLELYVKQ